MPYSVHVREAIRGALRPLSLGQNHTKSSAIHNLRYTGRLAVWANFRQAVEAVDHAQRWSSQTIEINLLSRDIHAESVHCGNEATVHGRILQSIGQLLGHALSAQGMNVKLGDFKILGSIYRKETDLVMRRDNGGSVLCVIEVKTWWVWDHHISLACCNQERLRRLLAQPIMYMQGMNCRYGCLANGKEFIFLEMTYNATTAGWEIAYSPVIKASDFYVPSGQFTSPIVSVNQCFMYVAHMALGQAPLPMPNNTPNWVVSI